MRIAYQGEPGAFSEAASRRRGPGRATLVPCRSFEDVFDAVEAGSASYGVVPIENSIGGSIHRNYDLLLAHDLPIVAEVELPVVHHLLALPGATLGGLRRVYSHPQGLAQCERFLRTLSGVDIVATYDTAGSAKMVADSGLLDAGAIASARAGEVFGLTSLAASVQDFDDNITRFLVIGRQPLKNAVADKTSIVFTLANEAGIAVQGAQRVRAARRGPDQARVAAHPGASLGVSVLRGPRGGARRGVVRARAGAPGRVRAHAADARLLRQLEDPGEVVGRPRRGEPVIADFRLQMQSSSSEII